MKIIRIVNNSMCPSNNFLVKLTQDLLRHYDNGPSQAFR